MHFIKFIEGDQESLDKACKLAEKNGYAKMHTKDAIRFEGNGVLICEESQYFTVSYTDRELKSEGYTELKEEPPLTPEYIIGQEYEFSDDGEDWSREILGAIRYRGAGGWDYSYIRPISSSPEELQARAWAESNGYTLTKK